MDMAIVFTIKQTTLVRALSRARRVVLFVAKKQPKTPSNMPEIVNWPQDSRRVIMMDAIDSDGNIVVGSATFEEVISYNFLGLEGVPRTVMPYCIRSTDVVLTSREAGFADERGNISFPTIITNHSNLGNVVLIRIPHLCLKTKFSIVQDYLPVEGGENVTLQSYVVPNYSSGPDMSPIWKVPTTADYEFWLMAAYPQVHDRIYFFAVKKSNRAFIGRPPLPNVFDDCRFCAGRSDNPWCERGANDPTAVAKGALLALYGRPWQRDLLNTHTSTTSKRIFRFDVNQNQLDTTTLFSTDMTNISAPVISKIMSGVPTTL